jgi:hypothetical protein
MTTEHEVIEPPEWFYEWMSDAAYHVQEGDQYATRDAWLALVEHGTLSWRTDKAREWMWNGTPTDKDGPRSRILVLVVGRIE